MNTIEQKIKEIYNKYSFSKDGYCKNDTVKYLEMDKRNANITIDFREFVLNDYCFSHNSKTMTFINGEIRKSSLGFGRCNIIFINVIFDDCTFLKCNNNHSYFIDCIFEDSVFKESMITNAVFLNCNFINTSYTTNTRFMNCNYINTNVNELFEESNNGEKVSKILNEKSNKYIQDTSVFGLFDESDKYDKEKNDLMESVDGNYHNVIFAETILRPDKNYHDCHIVDMLLKSEKYNNRVYNNCTFENCKFINIEFTEILFDNSRFINCVFENCKMYRCSLIHTTMDDKTKLGVILEKCNTYNLKVDGTTDTASFIDTYNPTDIEQLKKENEDLKKKNEELKEIPNETQNQEHGNFANQEGLIEQLNLIISALQSEEYINSLQKKHETHEEEVLEFFKTKDLQETSLLLTTILNNQNNKLQNQVTQEPKHQDAIESKEDAI